MVCCVVCLLSVLAGCLLPASQLLLLLLLTAANPPLLFLMLQAKLNHLPHLKVGALCLATRALAVAAAPPAPA